jgi:plasmid stabilization system protein ParE
MPSYELTSYAEEDLTDIIEYTVNNYGIAHVRDYVAALETCAENRLFPIVGGKCIFGYRVMGE